MGVFNAACCKCRSFGVRRIFLQEKEEKKEVGSVGYLRSRFAWRAVLFCCMWVLTCSLLMLSPLSLSTTPVRRCIFLVFCVLFFCLCHFLHMRVQPMFAVASTA